MWAPRVMDLARIREVKGLEGARNRACVQPDPHVHPSLTHLSTVMEPAIEQVSDKVYSAVGFDVANSTFIIGKDAVIVIDAMTSTENMSEALTAFREICDFPVTGVVYTHSHGDHWAGSPALVDANRNDTPVIAHDTFAAEVARINGFNQPIMAARSAYQHGAFLPSSVDGRVNVGAGPFLDFGQSAGLISPNLTLRDRLDIEIAGVQMEIVWVPSEAPDEIAVWLPQFGVLQSAECIQGECFPNIYTLRGDVPRPAQQWVDSLDVLRRFPAEALTKSHGRSVVGTAATRDHLRNYRDVIAQGDHQGSPRTGGQTRAVSGGCPDHHWPPRFVVACGRCQSSRRAAGRSVPHPEPLAQSGIPRSEDNLNRPGRAPIRLRRSDCSDCSR